MHHKTVHDTPMGKTVMRRLALIIFRFTGWRPAGKRPCISKYVIIAAPHTSNWDFVYTICLAFILEIKPFIMMKGAWFRCEIDMLDLQRETFESQHRVPDPSKTSLHARNRL